MIKFVVSSLLIGLAFGLVVTIILGVSYRSQDKYDIIYVNPNPHVSTDLRSSFFTTIKSGSVYGFPLAWNTVRLYETTTFCFRELNIPYLLLDTVFLGAIGGVPLAFWVVRREDMKLKWKIAKFVFLAISIPLLLFSPLFIFHPEKIYYPYPSPPPGYFWGYNIYYVLFGAFLLTAGIVLIVASYYRPGEANLPKRI